MNSEQQVRNYVADQHRSEALAHAERGDYSKGAASRFTEWKVRHGERRHNDPRR
jgi:hypothetical protein